MLRWRTRDRQYLYTSASFFDLPLSIGRDGQLCTPYYGKHEFFNFHITFFCSRVAKYHLRPCMAFYLTVSTVYKGVLLFWMFSYKNFHTSFLDKDLSGNVWNRLLWYCSAVKIFKSFIRHRSDKIQDFVGLNKILSDQTFIKPIVKLCLVLFQSFKGKRYMYSI